MGLFVLAMGAHLAARGAEDPLRFIAVPIWHGSVEVVGDGSGTGALGAATYSYDQHSRFLVQFELRNPSPESPITFEWWECPSRHTALYSSSVKWNCPPSIGGVTNVTGSANQIAWDDRFLNDCVKLSIEGTVEQPELSLHLSSIHFQGTGQTFNYDCGGRDSEAEASVFDAMPDEAIERLRSLPIPDTGLKVTANWSFDAEALVGNAGGQTLHWTVTVNLSGEAQPDELIVEPLHPYETWIPEAKQSEEVPANELGFVARLRNKNGGLSSQRAKFFRFELIDTSKVPGVCMNYPVDAGAVSAPDLQFTPERNTQFWKPFAGHGQKIESTDGDWFDSPPATLSSFDWGATAELKVTAVMRNGDEIVGHLEGEPEGTWIPIPRRQKNSKIADAWKEQHSAGGLADADDGEGQPQGDGDEGDGLTLYEEYRGFYARDDNQHQIGDPSRKDFFIWNWTGKDSGIALFASLSELNVHARLKGTQIRQDRVINFNRSGDEPHRVDQHAVILLPGALGSGKLGVANGGPGLPRQVSTVVINQSIAPAGSNALLAVANRSDKIVAHELLHSTNVWHHGTGDLRRLTWKAVKENGRLIYQEDGEEVLVVLERNGQIILPTDENDDMTVWLGVDQGEHSGNQDCVLRYSFADAYRERGLSVLNQRFYLGTDAEPDGFDLCGSKEGTGVNGSAHQPQSRYSHAGAGCCSHQICVNDAQSHGGGPAPRDCSAPAGRGGGDSFHRSLLAGGGAGEDGSPLVSLSANGSVEADIVRGWPVLVELEILHAASPRAQPAADIIIAPPAGDWTRAVRLSVKDEAGSDVPLAFLPQGSSTGPFTLHPGESATARYWIRPEDSARLAIGSYELRAVLDTASSTSGWAGTAASERVVLRAANEPAPLPLETEALKLLHFARFHLWRGALDAAGAALDALDAKLPDSIDGYLLRGTFFEARGLKREALSAYGSALDLFEAKFPDAAEPPAELLAAYQAVQARVIAEKLTPETILFRRGDFNGDALLDISDVVAILGYLFLGEMPGHECVASADGNGDRILDLSDAVYVLGFLFLGSSKPPPPFPGCGVDPAAGTLSCRRSFGCP